MNKFLLIFTSVIALIMSGLFGSLTVNASTITGLESHYNSLGVPSGYRADVPNGKYVVVSSYVNDGVLTILTGWADSPLEVIPVDMPWGPSHVLKPTGSNKNVSQYLVRCIISDNNWKYLNSFTDEDGLVVEYLNGELITISYSNHDIKYNGSIVKPSDDIVNGGVDVGFDNWTKTVTQTSGIYDFSVPIVSNFKVQYEGIGALAKHLLSWKTESVPNTYHVELKASYKFQSTRSWALHKDYNESTFTFIDYSDNYKSVSGALKFALSSSNDDKSIIAKALQDVVLKFGQAESLSGLTANDSSNAIKAYYIRNVYKSSDGKYHYGRWVRCKIGDMYQASTVTEIDENGNTNTGSTDYPTDANGNPIYDADGGNISTGNSFFDTIISAVGGIGTFFATLGTMVTSLVSGIGQVPQVLSALLSGFPPIIWSMVALGFVGVIVMRFVGR